MVFEVDWKRIELDYEKTDKTRKFADYNYVIHPVEEWLFFLRKPNSKLSKSKDHRWIMPGIFHYINDLGKNFINFLPSKGTIDLYEGDVKNKFKNLQIHDVICIKGPPHLVQILFLAAEQDSNESQLFRQFLYMGSDQKLALTSLEQIKTVWNGVSINLDASTRLVA